MTISVTAKASATLANQPSYDLGGFPVKVVEVVAGESAEWESLFDEVTIKVDSENFSENEAIELVAIDNVVLENDVSTLPADPMEHTAGKIVLAAIEQLAKAGVEWKWPIKLEVKKGISVKGTGLGSSGASPAAALKAFENLMERLKIDYKFDDKMKAKMLMDADLGVPDNSIPSYFGELVRIEQIEGNIEITQIPKHPEFGLFVAVTPRGFGIKTTDARKALEGLSHDEGQDKCVEGMLRAIREGNADSYGELMEAAHQWFVGPRSRLYPDDGAVYDGVYQVAHLAGACGVTIGGAGPTMLAVVKNREEGLKVGRAMHGAFRDAGFDSVARLVDIDQKGAMIIS